MVVDSVLLYGRLPSRKDSFCLNAYTQEILGGNRKHIGVVERGRYYTIVYGEFVKRLIRITLVTWADELF